MTQVIYSDLRVLETEGIKLRNGVNLKGCLTDVCFDNLGANICYGFNASFNAHYFCRFCISIKEDCKQMTVEDGSKIRDVQSYHETCALLMSDPKVNTHITKGVKNYCILNDLSNFHMLKNLSVDPMHDFLEGSCPFLLECLFNFCIKENIVKYAGLQNLISFFNYGELNKKNIPSKLNLERKNLGQNSAQMHALILNLPFILIRYKDQLSEIWPAVETMLQILEILFSEKYHESDVQRLEFTIKLHLEYIKSFFKVDLRPKHHLTLHYGRVIRSMGPLITMCNMRLEAKHQYFKNIARKNRSIVTNKALSQKHQEMLCINGPAFEDDIKEGKETAQFIQFFDCERYFQTCMESFLSDDTCQNAFIIKSLRLNNFIYKPGLLLLYNTYFIEINHILRFEDNYWFLSDTSFTVKQKDKFCNSLLLEENTSTLRAISLFALSNKETYQKLFIQDQIHVISNNLKLYHLCG